MTRERIAEIRAAGKERGPRVDESEVYESDFYFAEVKSLTWGELHELLDVWEGWLDDTRDAVRLVTPTELKQGYAEMNGKVITHRQYVVVERRPDGNYVVKEQPKRRVG